MTDPNAPANKPVADQPSPAEASAPSVAPPLNNKILSRMLERLFATLVNGPSLNCRPHSSRQRIDLSALGRLQDLTPELILEQLLGPDERAKIAARAPMPQRRLLDLDDPHKKAALTDIDRAALTAWRDQETVLAKLRTIAEDSKTYEQDTGVHVLSVGFPLLSLPPSSAAGGSLTRRIVAPIAFIPVAITVKQGTTRSIELQCAGEGTDRVVPNTALLAWLEQQSGKLPEEHFADDDGQHPWREIRELVAYVSKVTEVPAAEVLAMLDAKIPVAPPAGEPATPADKPPAPPVALKLTASPRTDAGDEKPLILSAAVLGLFPLANQGLLRDMQAMVAGESLDGPIESFIKLTTTLQAAPPAAEPTADPIEKRGRIFAEERLISAADPCQARAVRLARQCATLVIHGPPGTGKSQTITNIIGDHLSRGERVLVVSDKRTALDVVANRLRHLGLGSLFGVVHDPQRDQRELYKAIRQQLDDLPEAPTHPHAARQLENIDTELQRIHEDVTQYAAALSKSDPSGYTFHDLVGEWFGIIPPAGLNLDEASLEEASLQTLDQHTRDIQDIFERAKAVDLPHNPWRAACGVELTAFLAKPMAEYRAALARCVTDANAADTTAAPNIPPFAAEPSLQQQGKSRAAIAEDLAALLSTADPAVLANWAGRTAADLLSAKSQLDAAAPQLTLLHQGPLDAELLAKFPATGDRLSTAREWKVIHDYATTFRNWSARITAVRIAAPTAGPMTLSQWLPRETAILERARKRLDEMKPLADAITAAPLDRQMAMQFARQPIAVPQIIMWIAQLNEYLETASKWYAFLKSGAKSAAKPIAQYFGLSLDPATAAQMRDFLTRLRARLDLKADLENGILLAPFPALPADDELLAAWAEHRAVVTAAFAKPGDSPAAPMDAHTTELIHSFMKPQFDAASPMLAAYGLPAGDESATRLANFLARLNARLQLTALHYTLLGRQSEPPKLLEDAVLDQLLASHTATITFR